MSRFAWAGRAASALAGARIVALRSTRCIALSLAATAALGTPAGAQTTDARIVSGSSAAAAVELRGLAVGADGSVTGTVANGSGLTIADVELLVTHTWSWTNEHHPGDDSPGRASRFRVAGQIAPRSSMPFSYTPDPPLPQRTDGSFRTEVAVQSFTEIGRR